MKNKLNSIFAIILLLWIGLACNASFTTANIGSLNFGKNDSANPPTTTFEMSDKIYAVANVANSMSKHKMRFKVFYENKKENKSNEVLTKEIDFEGSRPITLNLTVNNPGEYKVEAVLLDEQGKEIDKKSGTITVNGNPTATQEPKDSDNSDSQSSDDN